MNTRSSVVIQCLWFCVVCTLASTLHAKRLGAVSRLFRQENDLTCEESDCGAALNLTPLLAAGKLADARAASEVHGIGNITSYAGFFETQASTDNNMFWWYFPPQDGNKTAPTVIWLQGGPGGSSLFGLFAEMGPFGLTADLKLYDRASSWNKKYGMLFIDNPVGAGFSYTTTDAGYCTDTKQCVASNLLALLQQFYTLFPDLQTNDLWVTGESYGGHYVPAISYAIHEHNAGRHARARKLLRADSARAGMGAGRAGAGGAIGAGLHIPLKGLAIGDGWVDPVVQLGGYADMMHNLGLADDLQYQHIKTTCESAQYLIQQGAMRGAFQLWDEMINGDIFPYPNYFHNITGSNDYDNFMNTNAPAEESYWAKYMNQAAVRKAVHVGGHTLQSGHVCEMHLVEDFMVSLKPELTVLMDNYDVLIYSGQLDIIIGAALTNLFLPTIKWTGQDALSTAARKVWRIHPDDVEVAGYATEVAHAKGTFSHVIVRGAGHIVPGDQPERALSMITHLIEGIPYTTLPNPKKSAQ